MRRLVILAALLTQGAAGGAQSLLERTPNITGNWVGVPGTLHFNFLHRFTSGEAPVRKVVSSPTFLIAVGLPRRTLVGFNYATNSDVAPRYPNEWEPFIRWSPFEQEDGALLDLGVQAAYNVAARSADGEASIGQRFGPVRVRGAARYLSNAYDLDESRVVLAGGAVLRFGPYVAVSGDYAAMLDRPEALDDAWSAALQLAIPYSPHTFSLHVTNANTATLQGSSTGRNGLRRYGFEFTIPVTLRRYFGARAPVAATPDSMAMPTDVPAARTRVDSAAMARDTVRREIDTAARRDSLAQMANAARRDSLMRLDSIARRDSLMRLGNIARRDSTLRADSLSRRDSIAREDSLARARAAATARDTAPARRAATPPARRPAAPAAQGRMRQFTFSPGRMTITAGTTVTWTNSDPVPHTITADDGSWNSGIIEPGKVWRHRFDRPGTYAFHCTPHPFMKGVIIVRAP